MEKILSELKKGRFVIISDDKHREDEADLVIAAEHITPEKIAFMLDHCSGIICVPMSRERIERIGIPIIQRLNHDDKTAPFSVAVDAKECHTGVSAYDRYLTIKKLCDDSSTTSNFSAPGHIFPLYAHPEGLKKRKGHTEAAVELMKLAGLKNVAVICELMNSTANLISRTDIDEKMKKEKIGTMMREDDVKVFAKNHCIQVINISDLL
jgi:3,4-dihydroxy 2-butanone 4-phosphate synthase/GTP cyclohydrolase II